MSNAIVLIGFEADLTWIDFSKTLLYSAPTRERPERAVSIARCVEIGTELGGACTLRITRDLPRLHYEWRAARSLQGVENGL